MREFTLLMTILLTMQILWPAKPGDDAEAEKLIWLAVLASAVVALVWRKKLGA